MTEEYDYYFLLGASYSMISRNYGTETRYAFRPSSVYFYLRENCDDGCVGVESVDLSFGLSGCVITSATSSIGDDTIFPGSSVCPVSYENIQSGRQYSYQLTSLWSSSGFSTSQYLWCCYSYHAFGLSMSVNFERSGSLLKKHVYIEHAIVAEEL